MAKRKVPSQVASGRETFNDNLVGNQITDGTSQLTSTNFSLDKSIPQRDRKSFQSKPFSEYLTFEDIKEEEPIESGVSTITTQRRKDKVKFRNSNEEGSKSLFGSLKQRLQVSVSRIISKFPAGFYIDKETPTASTLFTALNSTYNKKTNVTSFQVENSKIFNPLDVVLVKPKSNTLPETTNIIKNFYDSYKRYELDINSVSYQVISYTEVNLSGLVSLTVKGSPFGTSPTYSDSFLIRPNNSVVEEFFEGLDDLEAVLLNRESKIKYTAKFRAPQDSLDGSKTELKTNEVSWPLYRDKWNLKISGSAYVSYVEELSSLGDRIDDYKSNVVSRFLTTASLSEFDTEDRRMDSATQLLGHSFDQVKKFIDNIAYMRNVSYDRINNLPDVLLKNLSNTLGLDTLNLFDEKNLQDSLYTRVDSQYDGVSLGMNMVEAETEFYRRLVINLSHIYKSKGTRKAIEFFLRFIGAPEPLININEYVYRYDQVKKTTADIDSDVYDLIQGDKTFKVALLTVSTVEGLKTDVTAQTSGFSYNSVTTTGSTLFSEGEYPVSLVSNKGQYGDAKGIESEKQDVFFQKGAGWYDITLNHRSSTELDDENSNLFSNPKVIKTKNKDFTYGEDYFDLYKQFSGLDYGYELHNAVDNNKTELLEDEDSKIFNRKNIQIYLSSSQGVDNDIYRQSRELKVSFGRATLEPQTGFTFAEYTEHVLNEQIRNTHIIRYKNNYIQLEDIYEGYLLKVPNPYSLPTVSEFINRMSPYWTQVVEQFIPATTLWTGGNIIENSRIGRSKFEYEKPCLPNEFTQNLFPEFENVIEEDLETILGDPDLFRGLTVVSGVTYTLHIDFNGLTFTGDTDVTISGETLTVTGTTCDEIVVNHDHAGLYDPYEITSTCTDIENVFFDNEGCAQTVEFIEFSGITTLSQESITSGGTQFDKTVHLPLLCDFKCYLKPQLEILECLWIDEIKDIIDNQVNKTYYKKTKYTGHGGLINNHAGWEEFKVSGNTEIGTTFTNELISTVDDVNGLTKLTETYDYEYAPLLDYRIFTDTDGIQKIAIVPYVYNIQLYSASGSPLTYTPVDFDCLDPSTFDFYFDSVYLTGTTKCDPKVKVYGDGTMYTLPEDPDNCELMSNVYFEVSGITFGNEDTVDDGDICSDCPPYNTDWPVNIFINCVGDYNEGISGLTHTHHSATPNYTVEYVSGCTFMVRNVREYDVIDISITDAANCDQKVRIEGLQQKLEWDPINNDITEPKSHFVEYSVESFLPGEYPDNGSVAIETQSGITYCDNYLGYTIQPKVQYRPTFDYGVKQDSKVLEITDGTVVISATTTWENIQTWINNGSIVHTNAQDISDGDRLLSGEFLTCPFGSEDFRDSVINGFSFGQNYVEVTVDNVDCLGTIKMDVINDRFRILPNTKVRVLTKTSGQWEFTEKYPEELFVRPLDQVVDPCCTYDKDYFIKGDYLINELGFPIEVTSLNLEYCERELFYHLTLNQVGEVAYPQVILYNGDVNDCILVQYPQQTFEDLSLSSQQYFQDQLDCAVIPTIEDINRPIYDEGCDEFVGVLLRHQTTNIEVIATYNASYEIGDIVSIVSMGGSEPDGCYVIIAYVFQGTVEYNINDLCVSPTSTPQPSPNPTSTPQTSSIPTPTPSPSGSPTPEPSPSPSPSVTEGSTPSPTPIPSPTPSPSPSPSVTESPTPTPTVTVTPNCDFDVDINIATPTPSPSPSPTPTPNCDFDVDIDIATPTPLPSSSPTPSPSPSPTPTVTANCDFDVDINIATPTPNPTSTPTPTPSPSPSPSPSVTASPTPSPSPSPSPSPTPNCDFDVDIDIATPTPTPSPSPTPDVTADPTATPPATPDATAFPTPSPSPSPSPTPTVNCDFDVDINIATPTPNPTSSPTPTPSPSPSPSPSVTASPTPSPSPSPTPSPTPGAGGNANFKIQPCDGSIDLLIDSTQLCNFGSLSSNPTTIQVGDYVQFGIGTGCPSVGTYCAEVIQAVSSGTPTAIITSSNLMNDCLDVGCVQ